jgi:hypothetical protein
MEKIFLRKVFFGRFLLTAFLYSKNASILNNFIVLDVPENIKVHRLTESFRKCGAHLTLVNFFQLCSFFYTCTLYIYFSRYSYSPHD